MQGWIEIPINPDPNNTKSLVRAYLEERNKLPSSWQEFPSLHHRSTEPLSKVKIQDLASRQVAAFLESWRFSP